MLSLSKFDADFLPRSQDIFLAIETNMAKYLPALVVEKNLGRNGSDSVLRTCRSIFPYVNMPYLKFPCVLIPQLV